MANACITFLGPDKLDELVVCNLQITKRAPTHLGGLDQKAVARKIPMTG